MITNNSFERSDLLLLLRPIESAAHRDQHLVWRARNWSLVLALLFYASLQLPAWFSYFRAPTANQTQVNSSQTVVENPAKTASAQEEVNAVIDTNERSVLKYEQIGVEAPVTWQIEYLNKEIQRHLENGVVQLKDSAEPGQAGTVIITGHSSNYLWAGGSYKTVFAPLLKAEIGDTLTIKHRGKLYTYQVSEVYEVLPTKIDLMNADSGVDLRLITCTPLGSTKKRLIVDAMQISPDRNNNVEFNGGLIKADTLPTAR